MGGATHSPWLNWYMQFADTKLMLMASINLNNIVTTLFFYLFRNTCICMPANMSADILKLVSFSPFDRCDSNKLEKINISLLSSMGVAYEHCATFKHLGDKN